ncbi:ABC transporter ATP-binding protein [Roseburia sp. MSJ-14]|uniref:ABC transporter ATP-binding protein n=1 Tax=Roseburia sp. MSJ-14 TaxID=2841514 RepID=UPI001C0F9300|nr:ABC transporter ATP-binding protein [Roseburia sp. MSJ-14]MBU5472491.1 ABC transporter ATP-binding protein/permease [Roseburia sp. MSJ-14]
MEEKKYKTLPMVKRLMVNTAERDKKQFGRIAVFTIAAAIYPFLGVFLPKIAIGILEQNKKDAGKTLLLAMAVYFVVAGILGFTVSYLRQVISVHNMRIRIHYLGDTFRKLTTMDYKYTENAKFFEENERALNAANNNEEGIEGVSNRLFQLPAKIITIVGMFVLAGTLNPWILLVLILHVFVTMWVSRMSHNYSYSKKEEEAKASRKINYYYRTTHDFSFGKDIRIYNFRDRILKNYQEEIKALTVLRGKIAGREYLLGFAGIFTLLLTNVVMYGILIYQAYYGMPISSFTMYISTITTLMASMLELGTDVTFVINQGQYVGDFFRLMDESLIDEGGSATKPNETLEIVFDHVSFRYPNTDTNVFTDLNFTIHKGERLAIVGVNGAGKSTLVKLMTGLFEPTEGHIYINGTDIGNYRKKELYSLYSAVFQDVNILAFTLRENVACKSENVDDERVKTALEKVGLWKKVESFEKGLDQMMLKVIDENGTDFSGGERQKLSIARGLYKDAPMVIMDEPTAALDALAEAEIYENFSSLVEGKTAVYISHRLASTRFCDKIALFDHDGLKEYGTHDELMERHGSYYEMFTVQGKYYQEEAEAV